MKYLRQVIILFYSLIFLLLPKPSFSAKIHEVSSMAKQGQVEAQFTLAEAYYFGKGTGKNLQQALFWYERAAQQGHLKAQRALGAMFELGQGTAKEPKKAAYWYQKSAEQGLPRAQTNLGILYETGVGVEKNYEAARLLYEKAAAQNYARAQTNLGRMYEFGTGVEIDYKKAFYWYQKAAENNYLKGKTNLGALYETGQGVEQNYAEAIVWYTEAAEQGYARAQFYLGRMFEQGLGVEKDIAQASIWYSKAVALGHVKAQEKLAKVKSELSKTNEKTIEEKQEIADQVGDDEVKFVTDVKAKDKEEAEQFKTKDDSQYFLGMLYLNGENGSEMDAEEAAYWFNRAAENGNIEAQYNLGLLYLKGEGVEKDPQKGIRLLQKAASAGSSDAQNSLGLLYLNGEGVKKDPQKGKRLLEQAAESGNVDAQNNLGMLYFEKDYSLAAYWFDRAARQDFPYAQYNLAVMYLDGLGVKQNKESAIFWMQKAASQGYLIAIKTLDSIMEKQPETILSNGNTSENYKSNRAAELYQQIIFKQQQSENVSQGVSINSNEKTRNDPEETQAAASMNSVADQKEKDIYAGVTRLRLEIERLTERIESGASDIDYDRYMQLKSPVFVIHDRERLETYQTELDKLLLDMTHQ
jgi:TPR repeat protein